MSKKTKESDALQKHLEEIYPNSEKENMFAIIASQKKIIELNESNIDRLMQELDECKNKHKLN